MPPNAHASLPRNAHTPAPTLGRVIHLQTADVWVVRHGGALAELDGRTFWSTPEALRAAAARAGLALSDLVCRTGHDR
ncbi:hypothetical protein [Azospirillum halopraeferens]|uniref:hypothetical protein n=1 Tax=Azospirillum halopraeferens TaxID=34010 RepID=UPI0004252B6D|nr:hypothetical protein [Azospirillum halopraeferens]